MTMAYNIHATHRLEPISGYDEITHLQFTAPMDKAALKAENGSGEEPGLPSGSCVSLNDKGALIAGLQGNAMPMFLLWNSSDPDGMPGAFTANEQNIAGISMNGATFSPAGDPLTDNSELMRNLYTVGADGNIVDTSGTASSLRRTVDENGKFVSYSMRDSAGNFTTWPATCGLEITTTEFDFSADETDFAPNALLTSPPADENVTVNLQASFATRKLACQKSRGGYLTVLDPTDEVPGSGAYHNVCGTVSRGIHTNENGVKVLYFWAERTLIPQAVTASPVTEYDDTALAGRVTTLETDMAGHTHDDQNGGVAVLPSAQSTGG